MKKTFLTVMLAGVISSFMLSGCGGSSTAPEATTAAQTTAAETTAAQTTAAETTAAASEAGSLTFEDLQDNYKILTDVYGKVEDLYLNDKIEQDDNIEALLTQAKDIISEMGELSEADFTNSKDFQDINDAMVKIIEGLGNVVDGMTVKDSEAETVADANSDVKYVDGFYATDGNGSDFMIAFYEGAAGDVAYINDGSDEAVAEYSVEKANLDDGTEYLLVTVGQTKIGYVENGDDLYIVDSDGNIYGAARLSEEEADALYQAVAK
ncbi:hypothetical protein BXO88_03665 [Oribacterium sp. C9]|uniref:hypothetical protein n=1 Tax=Oribacterium sp. C9 TaxID=1943579 RepID=UPI00098EC5B4|nr:hypothetical protein [Oribacterium sp. C9]OON87382.1 hypothetical protein BXO88_03665 [Oribacterium sp. C9]